MMNREQLAEYIQYVESILDQKKLPNIEIINYLSSKTYEGAYIETEILFVEDDAYDLIVGDSARDLIVRFIGSSIIPLTENISHAGEIIKNNDFVKRMVKYCHMTNDKISLIATRMDRYNDAFAVVGIGQFDKENTRWIARLRFEGQHQWTLQIRGNEKQIHFDKTNSKLLAETTAEESTIPETEFGPDNTTIINEIVNGAKKQTHGTMIVVLDENDAEDEADRLCTLNRGIHVSKFDIRKRLDDLIVPITSIDGAILIDSNGYCYGIGVILDGKASAPANSARGARYNSALVYVNNMKNACKKCLCIVISEDGMVNPIGTTNIDELTKNQLNCDDLFLDNELYYQMDSYYDGLAEMREAKESLLYGDPDCLETFHF